MKVLLDSCVWGGTRSAPGSWAEAASIADWSRDPGDEEILTHAFENAQVLITLDKDFGEIAVVRERPHSGIIRLVALRAHDQGPAVVAALPRYGLELASGAIVTVEPGRVRVRPAPDL